SRLDRGCAWTSEIQLNYLRIRSPSCHSKSATSCWSPRFGGASWSNKPIRCITTCCWKQYFDSNRLAKHRPDASVTCCSCQTIWFVICSHKPQPSDCACPPLGRSRQV